MPTNARLIVAWYNASGKMLGVKTADMEMGNAIGKTMDVGKGAARYQLLLVDRTTFVPLCAAWVQPQ
ncbi:MAG: hypothetical protein J5449_05810 [Oscillospiraceae bacterium]|nr:hypothetical protein [Oscillospiraceae bacterium]